MKPFAYQEDCLEVIEDARNSGESKALVVMACGLGKTAVVTFDVCRCLEHHDTMRVLYVCHQNEILIQASETFEEISEGGRTIGFFNGLTKHWDADVLFATFQTLSTCLGNFPIDYFDYIIVDEGHHSEAPTYNAVLQHFDPLFELAITATPDREDDKEIRDRFGDPVFDLSLPVALAHGYLTPVEYRIITDEIDPKEAERIRRGRVTVSQVNNAFVQKEDEEIVRLLEKYLSEIDNPRVIIFCPSIAYCDRMSELLDGSLAIHSKIPHKERRVRIELFKAGLVNTMLAVDYFNEGIDVPDANVIVFLRSTNSETVFSQQLGRGLRKMKGKKKVIVFDFVANFNRIQMINRLNESIQEARGALPARKKKAGIEPMSIEYTDPELGQLMAEIEDLIVRTRQGYYTHEEACTRVLELGFGSIEDYESGFSIDPRLPPNPKGTYRGHWSSWTHFLGQAEAEAERVVAKQKKARQTVFDALKIVRTPNPKNKKTP